MLKISLAYAGWPGLSPAISAQFTLEMCTTKIPYCLRFKVIKGHRCWHHSKARR